MPGRHWPPLRTRRLYHARLRKVSQGRPCHLHLAEVRGDVCFESGKAAWFHRGSCRLHADPLILMRERLLFLFVSAIGIIGLSAATAQPLDAAQSQSEPGGSHFTTPSGNIDCEMFRSSGDNAVQVACLIENATWRNVPKEPADCGLDFNPYEISLDSMPNGKKIVNKVTVGGCRGDIGPTCVTGDCHTLAYGKSETIGNITCTSRKTGVTCLAKRGNRRGFTIARAKYTVIK